MTRAVSEITWTVKVDLFRGASKISAPVIKQITKKILLTTKVKKLPLSKRCEIGVVITNDLSIKKLNKKYRDKNKPTDVLSFSMIEGFTHLDESPALGDLVISLPTASRQAKEYDVNLYQEILRLLIHGTLHLLGYDHENVSLKEAKKMRAEEDRIYENLLPSARGLVIEKARRRASK